MARPAKPCLRVAVISMVRRPAGRFSSMPNIAVQIASVGDASDIRVAASTQEPTSSTDPPSVGYSMQTVSVEAIVTHVATEVKIETPPAASSAQADVQQSSRADLADPSIRRSSSMPNIAVRFTWPTSSTSRR